MKFLLSVYICSVIDGSCIILDQEPYKYPKKYDTHYECVQSGLFDSNKILFAENFFTKEKINKHRIYPSFTCDSIKGKNA